jgi:hypothetical protein
MQPQPTRLNDITPEWLTQVLHASGELPADSSVAAIKLDPMGAGVGMMSSLSRILITYSEANDSLPVSLVIKLPADNTTNREVAEQYNLYLKEVRYYQQLAPLTAAKSPKMYFCDIGDHHDFVMLMEDVSDYRMGNQVTGATFEESLLCIDQLAQLHAAFWNKLDDVDWLPHIANSENATNMAKGAEIGWGQLLEFFGDFVPATVNGKRDLYLSSIDRLQQGLDEPPITFIHGDFRMDNMLFGQGAEHHPLVIVDFQGPLKGRGIQDVGYLLGHSVQTQVRRDHEKELVQRYVDGLAGAGIADYGFDMAWQDYRLAILYSWTVAVVIAGTLDPSNDRGFAWMSKMVKRNGQAIEDLDCLELL